MKIIAFTKHNPNYKEFNRPKEDSFKYYSGKNRIIVAIADGITRDLINGKYPNPSPAKKAADIFCKSFLEKQDFEYCNKNIAELNKSLKVDYLENDFAACVAVGGIIENNKLKYGFITDCGVSIFDEKGKLRFGTENEGPNSKGSIGEDVRKKYNSSFQEDKGRRIIRSKYRNNLSEPLAYGALTGEKVAMNYVRTGEQKVMKGDYIIFYSDGFYPILFSNKFNISKEFNKLENYFDRISDKIDGGEGTLVALKL